MLVGSKAGHALRLHRHCPLCAARDCLFDCDDSMPPADSPTPERSSSLISALSQLASPISADVLNLAATLRTQTDDQDAPAALDDDDLRRPNRRDRVRLFARQRDSLDQRDRLRRVVNILNRPRDTATTAYGDRVPSQNSLYDWSPAIEHDGAAAAAAAATPADEDDDNDDDELVQVLAELRREQPNTHPEILRVLGRSQLDSERERIRSISSRLSREREGAAGESLRSTAILQSVRRHPRFSARTREYLSRYNSEREPSARSSGYSDHSSRYMSESARQMANQRLAETRSSLDRESREMLASRAESYRRGYLDHRSSTSTPTVSPMLEQAVKYLSRIRQSSTIEDSYVYAEDAGFLTKDHPPNPTSDFVTETFSIPPPVETSWLAPGAVLSGCQHATSATAQGPLTAAQLRLLAPPGVSSSDPLPPPQRPWLSAPFPTTRYSPSPSSESNPPILQDRWPVKVTIHEVDWDHFSLSATMEAYNVPSHPHTHQSILSTSEPMHYQYTRTSSITTYLEGEILDFNTHTLLTESFKSTPANDAMYWRKLPPFADLSDEEVVLALTSRRWFEEVLSKDWVLMRWKERCFVKPLARSNTTDESIYHASHLHPSSTIPPLPPVSSSYASATTATQPTLVDAEHAAFDDSGCGLTISGFYYVCLRRQDGRLEGLYCDPQSSPYQCLRLESVGGGWGSWGFR